MAELDPRLLKAIRELDATKKALTSAQRKVSIYRTLLAKEKALRTADAKPRQEQHPACRAAAKIHS